MPTSALTLQLTAVLVLPATTALNCWVAFAPKFTEPGVIVTETPGVNVTVAVADWVPSAIEVARTLTVCSEVTEAGAE